MASGDIYILKDFQRHGGQETSNVWGYRQNGGDGGAAELVAAYIATVIPEIRTVQNVDVTHVQVEAQNVADDTDFATTPISPAIEGADSGNYFATFAAWGFKKPRDRTSIKNGSFRIAGVTSSLIVDGTPTAGSLAELSALAESLGTPLEDGGGNEWIFGYFAVPRGQTQPVFVDVPVPVFMRLTTQNSRKVGVGQ